MSKPRTIHFGKSNNSESTQVNNSNSNYIQSDSYLERRGLSSSNLKRKNGFFIRINNKLNELSSFQFLLLLLIVASVSFIGFQKVTGSSLNPINNIIESLPINSPNKPDCNNDLLNPACWPNKIVPQLEQTDGKTNALLVGLDTRDDNKGLMNADTLMVASYDHQTGKTLLISFPRDLYLSYSINGNSTGYYTKVNSIYALGENNKSTDGMSMVKENVENWLGLEIHYTAKVNFKTLTSIVDAIDGVTITLDKEYTDIYPYKELSEEYQKGCKRAVDMYAYCVFRFSEGENHLNGEMALIYARMRQYSSDFDRARRQQEVIDAIKEKTLNGEGSILEKASFGWKIMQSLQDDNNIDANIDNNDLIAAALLVSKADLKPISIVLDPTFGGGGYMIEGRVGQDAEGNGGQYVIKVKDTTFGQLRKEIDRVREFPDIYRDNASVVLVNATGIQFDTAGPARSLEKLNPTFDFLMFANETKRESIKPIEIFVFNHDKVITANYLKDYFEVDNITYINETSEEKQTGYLEDIKVVFSNPISTITTDETEETN